MSDVVERLRARSAGNVHRVDCDCALLRAAADHIEALTDERDEAVALLRDWHESGVAFSDSRLDYEERQVDVGTIAETRAFLSRQECAACGGIGKVRQLRGPTPAVEIHPCLSCDGTGQRLAIKEMLDE